MSSSAAPETLAQRRRRRLCAAMEEEGLDLLVIYGNAWQGDYLRYAIDYGVLEGEALAVVGRGGEATLYLDHPFEADRAALEAPDVATVYAPDMLARVEALLEKAGDVRIGAGPKRLLPRRIASRAADLRISDQTALVDRLLMNKLDVEIAAIRAAASMADDGYEVFRKAARVGRADYELVAEVETFYRRKGVDDNFMIIGVGGAEVRGMAPPSGKRLKPGDLVTTELTPCVNGYYVQICRTLVLGEPSAVQTSAFAVFREALEAGLAAVRPGVTAADVAKAENDIFRRHGLGDYVTSAYTRVRGHGLGLFADSKPHILESVNTIIEKGMTLIVHPNTYHPEAGYIVLGDALIVTEAGADVLTRTPRDLIRVAAN